MNTLRALLALSAMLLPTGSAVSNVTVEAQVGVLEAGLPALIDCPVDVPAGSNGTVVLDAMVAKGCISSYEVQHYSFGDFVSCIDGICGQDAILEGTFWAFSVNGA